MVLPLVAMAAIAALLAGVLADALSRVAHALGFAGPAVAGALAGLALARPDGR
jgi:hypothetical protein